MKPHIRLNMTVGTFMNMSDEQAKALRENILAEGRWETVDTDVRIDGGDYLGVYLPSMFVGIEKDGYTHS